MGLSALDGLRRNGIDFGWRLIVIRFPLLAGYLLSFGLPGCAQIPNRAWEHQPVKWSESGDALTETVPSGTDYWRVTHYGFIRDNGPFRYQEQSGDFEAKVQISGEYRELYHQAALMIRIDEKNWIKTGIEFVNGKQNISAVVTREVSDWSVIPRSDSPKSIWLRLQRHKDAVRIEYSLDDATWTMLRLAYFPPGARKDWYGRSGTGQTGLPGKVQPLLGRSAYVFGQGRIAGYD
jgi:regulation of enolase protein 1 (concanavalin A-like superfamily)